MGAGVDGGPQKKGNPKIWVQGGMGDPKMRGIPKEGSMDGIPKYGESQTMGAGMDGESLGVGDPKIWGAGVDGDPKRRGIPKYGSRDGWGREPQNKRNPKIW